MNSLWKICEVLVLVKQINAIGEESQMLLSLREEIRQKGMILRQKENFIGVELMRC